MLDAHPPVACEKDGVALDVTVDDALVVQVGQGSQDRQADGRYLLLVHPETPRWKNALSINEESGEGTWSGEAPSSVEKYTERELLGHFCALLEKPPAAAWQPWTGQAACHGPAAPWLAIPSSSATPAEALKHFCLNLVMLFAVFQQHL